MNSYICYWSSNPNSSCLLYCLNNSSPGSLISGTVLAARTCTGPLPQAAWSWSYIRCWSRRSAGGGRPRGTARGTASPRRQELNKGRNEILEMLFNLFNQPKKMTHFHWRTVHLRIYFMISIMTNTGHENHSLTINPRGIIKIVRVNFKMKFSLLNTKISRYEKRKNGKKCVSEQKKKNPKNILNHKS